MILDQIPQMWVGCVGRLGKGRKIVLVRSEDECVCVLFFYGLRGDL